MQTNVECTLVMILYTLPPSVALSFLLSADYLQSVLPSASLCCHLQIESHLLCCSFDLLVRL